MQNANFWRGLTYIFYEILRHLQFLIPSPERLSVTKARTTYAIPDGGLPSLSYMVVGVSAKPGNSALVSESGV